MPFGGRRKVIEFSGDDLTTSSHPEVDASSFTDALLHCSRSSATAINIHLEAAPEDFGTTPTWHRMWRGTFYSANLKDIGAEMTFAWTNSMPNDITVNFPCDLSEGNTGSYGFPDLRIPRRFRIVTDQNVTALAIELTRRRG